MSGKPTPLIDLPRLALQIGVTGHRQLSLDTDGESALQARITTLLQTISGIYQQLANSKEAVGMLDTQDLLTPRLLSSLAEGADSLAAEAALTSGYELHCPLPFPYKDYANDFQGHALQTFKELHQKAERVLELDGVYGVQELQDDAYRNTGSFVLRHSDLLLAVWDGKENKASPGTACMVALALQMDMPILWIRPYEPNIIEYHDPRDKKKVWQTWDSGKLADLLRCRLLPPEKPVAEEEEEEEEEEGEDTEEEKAEKEAEEAKYLCGWQDYFHIENHCCKAYFKLQEPKRNLLGTVYRTLFSWFGKRSFKKMLGNPYQQDANGQWHTIIEAANASASKLPINPNTGPYFIHADSLASFYADKYRGTFVATFLLGGVAVLWALLGSPLHILDIFLAWLGIPHPRLLLLHEGKFFAGLEFFTIGFIAALVVKGRLLNYHQRWVDFRLLAERLRHHAFLNPIGGVSQSSQPFFHSHDDHSYALINWLVRTISRAEGIPATSFNTDYRQAYRNFLIDMIDDQIGYHRNNYIRNRRIAHTLHFLNKALLLAIVVACWLHFLDYGSHEPNVAAVLTLFAAVLPALGAGIAGILGQGEFERIAKRSKGMKKHLKKIKKDLKESPDVTITELAAQARLVIDTMSQELYDWRIIFRIKPLEQHA